jgi:hypothetical protein
VLSDLHYRSCHDFLIAESIPSLRSSGDAWSSYGTSPTRVSARTPWPIRPEVAAQTVGCSLIEKETRSLHSDWCRLRIPLNNGRSGTIWHGCRDHRGSAEAGVATRRPQGVATTITAPPPGGSGLARRVETTVRSIGDLRREAVPASTRHASARAPGGKISPRIPGSPVAE